MLQNIEESQRPLDTRPKAKTKKREEMDKTLEILIVFLYRDTVGHSLGLRISNFPASHLTEQPTSSANERLVYLLL